MALVASVSLERDIQKNDMIDFWLPTGNRFVTECEIKIEACKRQLRGIVSEIIKIKSQIEIIKINLKVLDKSIDIIQSKNILIVSLAEFSKIKREKRYLLRLIKANEGQVENMEFGTAALKKEISRLEDLKKEIESKIIEIGSHK